MYYFLLVPMIMGFATESLLWKRNKLKPLASLIGNATWRFVFVFSVFMVFFAINGTEVFDNLTLEVLGFTLLLHVFGVSAVMLMVKIMQNMCVSIVEPLSLFRIIPLTILSWLIFGGNLSPWEFVLVALIFVFCASLGFFQRRHESNLKKACCTPALDGSIEKVDGPVGDFNKGLIYMALWTLCAVTMDLIINHMSHTGVHPITFSALRAITFLGVAFLVFMIFKRGNRKETLVKAVKNKIMIMIGAIFALHSILFITLLLNVDNVGILAAIGVTSVPLVVLCGTLLMKERIKWYSYIFIGLIVACVIILTIYQI